MQAIVGATTRTSASAMVHASCDLDRVNVAGPVPVCGEYLGAARRRVERSDLLYRNGPTPKPTRQPIGGVSQQESLARLGQTVRYEGRPGHVTGHECPDGPYHRPL